MRPIVPSRFRFETSCLNASGPDIDAMLVGATRIGFSTMTRIVGEPFVALQHELGYDTRAERGGLRMRTDVGVSCWRSRYRGVECAFVRWSAIEYIFVPARHVFKARSAS